MSHMFLGLIFHEPFLVVARIVKVVVESHIDWLLKFAANTMFLFAIDSAVLRALHGSYGILSLSNI